MYRSPFRSKTAWVMWMMCWLLALPLIAQAAAPSATPRQQKMLEAMRNSSKFGQTWNEKRLLFSSTEDTLRRLALIRRCLPRPDHTRFFQPAYRQYVETVGGAFYRYLQQPIGAAAGAVGQQRALWAIDQLSEAQYKQSMLLLTSADLADARAVADLGWALGSVMTEENLVDVSSGYGNVAMLAQFKQTLIQTGQLEPVLAALAKADPALPEAFKSLEFLWPVPADKWDEWQHLALLLEKHAERIQDAYWANWPEPLRKQVEMYLDNPLFDNVDRAQEAEQAWSTRMALSRGADLDVAALTDTERLGRKIHFYFGETGTQRSDAELIKAHDWLRRESQAYIDAHKSQICGG